MKGREQKHYTRLGDIAFTNLIRRLKKALAGKGPGHELVDLLGPKRVAENLVHIGLLKKKGKKSYCEVALKVDRCRYIQYLNRIMMLEMDDQDDMVDLLHEEIQLLRLTDEAHKLQNLRGIFGKCNIM